MRGWILATSLVAAGALAPDVLASDPCPRQPATGESGLRFQAACLSMARRDWRAARERLDEAVALAPSFLVAYRHRAIVESLLGLDEAADSDLREGSKTAAGQDSVDACLCAPGLAATVERLEARRRRGAVLKQEGIALFFKGRGREAQAWLTSALAAAPGDGEAFQSRAVVRETLGDRAGAAEDYEKAARLFARRLRDQTSALDNLARLRPKPASPRPAPGLKVVLRREATLLADALRREAALLADALRREATLLANALRREAALRAIPLRRGVEGLRGLGGSARRLWEDGLRAAGRYSAAVVRASESRAAPSPADAGVVDARAYCREKLRGLPEPAAVEAQRQRYLEEFVGSLLSFAQDEARVSAGRQVTAEMVDSAFAAVAYIGTARDEAKRRTRLFLKRGAPVSVSDSRLQEPTHSARIWRVLAESASGQMQRAALEGLHDKASLYDLALLQLAQRGFWRRAPSPESLAAARELLHQDELSAYMVDFNGPMLPAQELALAGSNRFMERLIAGLPKAAPLKPLLERLCGCSISDEALAGLSQRALPELLRPVWLKARAQVHEPAVLVPPEVMARAIRERFPDLRPSREAEALQGQALPWTAILTLSRRLGAPLDPYAADEAADLLEQLTVPLLKAAARRAGPGRTILAAHLSGAVKDILARPGRPAQPPARSAGALFKDVTAGSGLTRGLNQSKEGGESAPGAMSLALLDFDDDGLTDILICDGRAHLLRNQGRFRFEDVTFRTGLADIPCSRASAADFDNDGWTDLLLTDGGVHLLKNRDGKVFEDVTGRSGIGRVPERVRSNPAVVWLDYDRDGLLDFYLAFFGPAQEGALPALGGAKDGVGQRLYRNLGRGRFKDVTAQAHAGDAGWANAATSADFDNDGWPDLYIGNDFGRSVLLRNRGDGTFADVSRAAGVDSLGHAMGASFADVDHDGWMDLLVTNVSRPRHRASYIGAHRPLRPPVVLIDEDFPHREENRLYRNLGDGTFRDQYAAWTGGIAAGFGWDGFFFDFDNSGDPGIFIMSSFGPTTLFYHDEGSVLLRWDQGRRRYVDASAGSGVASPSNSWRGVFADFDRRGALDLLVSGREGVRLFKNQAVPRGRHWLGVKLRGRRSNRDGIGARLKVRAGDWARFAQYGHDGGGFKSACAAEAHFGLGTHGRLDELEILWPSGAVQVLKDLSVDRRLIVEEPRE